MKRSYSAAMVGVVGLAVSACLLVAGPLEPPPGAIASTFKTLWEVEPRTAINAANTPGDATCVFKITQPGSYYLTGNVNGAIGKSGIVIAANDVVIDLNGFSLVGGLGSDAGVKISGGYTGITVKYGTARGWNTSGFDLSSGRACRAEQLTAVSNNLSGIVVGSESVISGCTARQNGGMGIGGASGVVIRGCSAAENGADGIFASEGGAIADCVARQNTGTGITVNGNATVNTCASVANQGGGYVSGYGCSFVGCTAKDNIGQGFWLNFGGTASECTAYSNTTDGFLVWAGSVSACQSSYNGRDGIRLDAAGSTAANNNCLGNGMNESGAGVRSLVQGCRIDSNQCYANDLGVVAAAEAIVVRNSARGNTSGNYSFPSGSEYGQIITNPGNGFVATNPWANFAY